MKYQLIGWLADKNHATIIHSVKTIDGLLEIRDSMTLTAMESWQRVFRMEFGSEGGLKQIFTRELDTLITESGLEHSIIEDLLKKKTTELSELSE
jgi:hypothetical protein